MTEMASAPVVSLAERLKQRRAELGLSQAQAARELDVARTAYRLWEMEAAKPQPDRWRLISRWLGVSVTTMLLADESEGNGHESTARAAEAFDRAGVAWDESIAPPTDFFASARELVADGLEKGFITAEHAEELLAIFARIEEEQHGPATDAWEPARLYRELRAGALAPREAREATAFVAADLPSDSLETARLLVSELVTNSVKYGQPRGKIGLLVDVDRERLRVEVADTARGSPQLRGPYETGGYGLALVDGLASRWHTQRVNKGNHTWFELDLPRPGAKPERH